jgi:hypothetical protein
LSAWKDASVPSSESVDAAEVSPASRALERRGTRVAVRRYGARAVALVAAGIAVGVVSGVLLQHAGHPHRQSGGSIAAALVGGVGFCVAAFGLLGLLNGARMWWVLREHPWEAWPCRFREVPSRAPNGYPTLVLRREEGDEEFVLGIVSVVWRWRALQACDQGDVWFAGNPARGGVAALPGGTYLFWARRPRLARWRESLRNRTVDPTVD